MGFSNLFHYNSAALECVTCFLTVSRIQTSFVVQSSLSSLEFYVGSPCLLAYHNELNNSMWTLKYVQAQFILSPKTQLRASSRFYHWLYPTINPDTTESSEKVWKRTIIVEGRVSNMHWSDYRLCIKFIGIKIYSN